MGIQNFAAFAAQTPGVQSRRWLGCRGNVAGANPNGEVMRHASLADSGRGPVNDDPG